MNLTDFLNHYALTENPFRGEEARLDAVFDRMRASGNPALHHSEFEKIVGDLAHPSASVVFGEKGTGKTAIRIQIAEAIAAHNQANPGGRLLFFAYDDLNSLLDRFHERVGGAAGDALNKFRLVDHLDAVLSQIVPRLVDAFLEQGTDPLPVLTPGAPVKATVARLDKPMRRDLLLLQAIYDRPEDATARTRKLQARLRLRNPVSAFVSDFLSILAPLLIAAAAVYEHYFAQGEYKDERIWWLIGALAGVWALYMIKRLAIDRLVNLAVARRVRKQVRVVARGDVSFARSIRRLDASRRVAGLLPTTDSDEARYTLLDRLLKVLRVLGHAGVIIVVDRVDEPTLIKGDPERMRAIVWPLLNNKFLQHDGLGVKLLLPIELRHILFKESSAFFQEARLDKQNLVERLSWTGSSLYDLCQARLEACRPASAPPLSIRDLFVDDVTKQEIVEALDQMHQPRDAFKLLYRCMAEHCAGVTRDAASFRMDGLLLETVKRQEAERIQALHRGIRPA